MLKHLATIQQIKQAIAGAERILLVTHQKPDGDGLGSLSALASYLTALGKSFELFCLDAVPAASLFLPYLHQVTTNQAIFTEEFDLLIVLDSSDLKYAGLENLLPQLPNQPWLINIDHHFTNLNYGQLNLVLPEKSSTSEIIYNLLRLWQFPLTKEIATALLNGVIFDTGVFSNSATSLSALEAAAHLLNLGARAKEVTERQIKNKSLVLLKLWGRAFERLVYNPRYDLAFTVITQNDIIECQAPLEAAEGISNFLNELSGAKIILVLKESENGQIKGSLRTTANSVDVSQLAKSWGGGGHAKAAGFSVKGKLVYNNQRWIIE